MSLDAPSASGKETQVTPEQAIRIVRDRFPFKGYMDTAEDAYINIAKTAQRCLKPGDSVLDFGAGPADKTAILQALGFRCKAYDDLQDDWHSIEGNRDKILNFARGFGIEYELRRGADVPFGPDSFDMVMMHDVIEHLHNSPRSLLIRLLESVRPGGYLFVTVPNAVNIRKRVRVLLGKTNLPSFNQYYWYPDPWRGHVREYTRDDLSHLAEYLDLDVIELRSCHHMLQKRLSGFLKPAYLGVTRIFPGWRDTWLLVAKKRPGWSPKKSLTREELGKTLKTVNAYQY